MKEEDETDQPELVEFEGETLGDTLTNLLTEVKRLREQPRVMIDDYDKVLHSEHKGYYVTLYIDGCEYIGALRLYKDEEGNVIE